MATGVGGGHKVRVKTLGKKQIGLDLVQELKGLAGVSLKGSGSGHGVGFDAKPMQGGEDRALQWITTEMVQMHHHLVAGLLKLSTEINQPCGDATDIRRTTIMSNADSHASISLEMFI
jgi:hypothetical protein